LVTPQSRSHSGRSVSKHGEEQAGVRGGKTWVWVWVSTKYPFGNLRWQQKIMAKKLNEVLHENPI